MGGGSFAFAVALAKRDRLQYLLAERLQRCGSNSAIYRFSFGDSGRELKYCHRCSHLQSLLKNQGCVCVFLRPFVPSYEYGSMSCFLDQQGGHEQKAAAMTARFSAQMYMYSSSASSPGGPPTATLDPCSLTQRSRDLALSLLTSFLFNFICL